MKNIIIADDFSTQRSLIKMMATSTEDINVLEAENGKEALKLSEKHDIDGIITDLEMPEMDGLELTKTIRKKSTKESLPIIMITSVDNSRSQAQQAGVNHFIHKPFDKDDVVKAIEQHIANQEGEHYHILLVDDDSKQTMVWQNSMNLPYFKFTRADSARSALKQLRGNNIDAIITDYKMPEVDGQMFVRKIKSMAEFSHIPVIMVSDAQFKEEINTDYGIEKVFTKPFDSESVKNELKKVLRIS